MTNDLKNIDQDWWKHVFDEVYLITDARSVCDHQVTCLEVDFLENVLQINKEWSILDLCGGQGRHALELSRRGFQQVTVVDYSGFLIDHGTKTAHLEGLNTRFIQKDARSTGLAARNYDLIMIMASSFGYFIDEDENKKVLFEVARLLRKGGRLILDLPDRDYVLDNFKERSWHEADEDILVCRQRKIEDDLVGCREIVLSKKKGLIREAAYCTRLYSENKISDLLNSTGLSKVDILRGFRAQQTECDLGFLTNRMVVVAEKGSR